MLCAAIAGMTTSPQLRESPETMNLQVPSFGGTNLDCLGDPSFINRLDSGRSCQTTSPRMITLTKKQSRKADENVCFDAFVSSFVWSGAAIYLFSESAFACI